MDKNVLLSSSANASGARGMGIDLGGARRGLGMPVMFYARDDVAPDAGTVARANHILSVLGVDEDGGDGAEAPAHEEQPDVSGEEADDVDVEAAEPGEGDEADTEHEDEADPKAGKAPSVPSIEPPVSWKAEEKEKFKALPRDLQEIVAGNERRRDDYVSQKQNEFAETTRTVQTERETQQTERATERAQHTHILNSLLAAAVQISPALAEAEQLSGGGANPLEGPGWINLARTNPAEYAQKQAEAKYALGQLQGAMGQAIQLHTKSSAEMETRSKASLAENVAKEWKKLEDHKELGPIWKDDAKRSEFQGKLKTFLNGNQFSDQEVLGITDARVMNVARKAMLYDELMAQKARIPNQRAPAKVPGKTVRAQASSDARDVDGTRMAAAKKQIKGVTRLDQQAEIIARALGR